MIAKILGEAKANMYLCDMKRTPALLVTLLFALSAIWTGVNDYQLQRSQIADDLTHALCLTVADQPTDWLSADTIRTYRQHLRLSYLRDSAVLTLCMQEDDKTSARGISGERINIRPDISAYGNVGLSSMEVWWMADHRLSLLFSVLTLIGLLITFHKHESLVETNSKPLTCLTDDGRLIDKSGRELHLTPMQRQLIQMFLTAPRRELSKETICDALWPRKDDASETLYALISRLKTVIEPRTGLRITSERGRSYRLTQKESSRLLL